MREGFTFPTIIVCRFGVIVGLPFPTSANILLHAANAVATPCFDEVIKAREEKAHRVFINCTCRFSGEGQSSGRRVARRTL